MEVWQVLSRLSAHLYETSDYVATDATFSDRKNASKYYCRRTNYSVQPHKTTASVATESQVVYDDHFATEKRHDTQIGWHLPRRNAGKTAGLAADKVYNWQRLR